MPSIVNIVQSTWSGVYRPYIGTYYCFVVAAAVKWSCFQTFFQIVNIHRPVLLSTLVREAFFFFSRLGIGQNTENKKLLSVWP